MENGFYSTIIYKDPVAAVIICNGEFKRGGAQFFYTSVFPAYYCFLLRIKLNITS